MKERKDSFVLLVAVAVFVVFILTCLSCHAIHGVGRDLQDFTSPYVEGR